MSREDNAPEVVEGNGSDGLIPASSSKSDAPQAYGNGPYGQQSPPGYQSTNSACASTDEKMMGTGATETAIAGSARSRKRKRMVWIIIGAVLLALAIGLGVGLGVGLSQNGGSDSNVEQGGGDSQNANNPPISTTSTISSSSETATPTASAVRSGVTGVAAFACDNDKPRKSENGTEYIQECNTQYSTGHASVNSVNGNVTIVNLGGQKIVYSFKECLDECDRYNDSGEEPACRAVTYYANITEPIRRWGGNCFLKNDQGTNRNGDNFVDWGHTASAYQSCLTKSCWPEKQSMR